eukprot:3515688-Karenia_brevis.AAC.1
MVMVMMMMLMMMLMISRPFCTHPPVDPHRSRSGKSEAIGAKQRPMWKTSGTAIGAKQTQCGKRRNTHRSQFRRRRRRRRRRRQRRRGGDDEG